MTIARCKLQETKYHPNRIAPEGLAKESTHNLLTRLIYLSPEQKQVMQNYLAKPKTNPVIATNLYQIMRRSELIQIARLCEIWIMCEIWINLTGGKEGSIELKSGSTERCPDQPHFLVENNVDWDSFHQRSHSPFVVHGTQENARFQQRQIFGGNSACDIESAIG